MRKPRLLLTDFDFGVCHNINAKDRLGVRLSGRPWLLSLCRLLLLDFYVLLALFVLVLLLSRSGIAGKAEAEGKCLTGLGSGWRPVMRARPLGFLKLTDGRSDNTSSQAAASLSLCRVNAGRKKGYEGVSLSVCLV